MVVGRLGGDTVQAHIGRDRMLRRAILLAACGIALLGLVPVFPLTLLGAVGAGIGVGVVFPAVYDAAAKSGGRAAGQLAAMTAGSRGGFLVLPLIVGGLAGSSLTDVGGAITLVALVGLATVAALVGRMSHLPTSPAGR